MEVTATLIEKYWPLTNIEIEAMPSQGMAGQVGIVTANEGKFTFKIAGSWKTSEKLNRDLSAYEFLNRKNFKYISQVLNTRDDKRFIEENGKLMYLLKFIEGEHPAFLPATYESIGKITAELHSIENFPFESDYKPTAALPDLIKNAEKYSFKNDYISILEKLPDFTKLSIVPIHTEITPGNLIQTPNGNMVVIDWDEVGLGPAVLDLGVSLINHFITEDLTILDENAQAYYRSYFSTRKMDNNEKKFIFDAALFWACAWITYGDMNKRWERIKWALKNRKKIENLYIE